MTGLDDIQAGREALGRLFPDQEALAALARVEATLNAQQAELETLRNVLKITLDERDGERANVVAAEAERDRNLTSALVWRERARVAEAERDHPLKGDA